MKMENIDDLVDSKSMNISYQELKSLLNNKLDELYKKEKVTPLLDYEDIQHSAKIDLILEIMPSLRDEIKIDESKEFLEEPISR